MKINVTGGEISEREIDSYIDYVLKKYIGRQIRQLDIKADGEYIDLQVHFKDTDFQHAFRSADYLVNDIYKMNDSKQSEFFDKTKSAVGEK